MIKGVQKLLDENPELELISVEKADKDGNFHVNNLVVNEHGIVIEGHKILLDYDHKDFKLKIEGADFGDYWGEGHDMWDNKDLSGCCSGISECYSQAGLKCEDDVINSVLKDFKDRIPEFHMKKIREQLDKKKQLSLF